MTDDAFHDQLDGGSAMLRATRAGAIERVAAIVARDPAALEATGHLPLFWARGPRSRPPSSTSAPPSALDQATDRVRAAIRGAQA